MGGVLSSIPTILSNTGRYALSRKRRRDSDEEIEKVIDSALHTPKRMRLLSTDKYIYHALFEEGKNSDVTVEALNTKFYLHKIYLCQSPYFASMFGGSWLESDQNYIKIDVVDPLITLNSLKIVFGSLYSSELVLNPTDVVSVLATARMFQLDGLIEKCTEVMLDTINPKTCLEYYNASCCYGSKKLKEVCLKWFLVNLMTYYCHPYMVNLKHIPVKLMCELVTHPDLFVLQTEYTLYILLKFWIYMIIHNLEEVNSEDVNTFFRSRTDNIPFLLTEQGERFIPAFQGLRLHNLISHLTDVEVILKDNIIPKVWMFPIFLEQWRKVLRINQNDDKGPSDVTKETFLSTSMRCGRIVTTKERYIWRWTGFHFGIDLVMLIDGTSLSIRRNHRSEYEQLLSFQSTRHLAIRVTVATMNEQRQTVYFKQSDLKYLCLMKGEEVEIMSLDKDITYPLIICANILYTSPENSTTSQEDSQVTS